MKKKQEAVAADSQEGGSAVTTTTLGKQIPNLEIDETNAEFEDAQQMYV